jgi:hypothetical protein
VVLTDLRGCIDIEINNTFEGFRLKMYMTIVTDIKPKVYAFIDGETCHQTMLVIDMGA